MNRNVRIFLAELVGTAVLIMGGPGSAILAGEVIGVLGVALAFGLSLMVMAYAIGPISGCHINPAVTLGLAVTRKIDMALVPVYWVAQLAGAAVGAVIIWGIANGNDAFEATNNFAANGWGDKIGSAYGLGSAIIVELVFTAVLVLVVLFTTRSGFPAAAGGLAVGFTLTLIHLITIPVDNTSVNPARSFGSALFSGADAWSQLWAFVVFPLAGAIIGAVIWLALDDTRLEDTALDTGATRKARDVMAGVADRIEDKLD